MIYVIIPKNKVTQEMIDASLETSMSSLRTTHYGIERAILKFKNTPPPLVSSYPSYTKEQIKPILDNPTGDWFCFIDEDE